MARGQTAERIPVYEEKIKILEQRIQDRERLLAEAYDKVAVRQKLLDESKAELLDWQRKLENTKAALQRKADKAAAAATKRKAKKVDSETKAQMAQLMQSIADSGLSVDEVMELLKQQ